MIRHDYSSKLLTAAVLCSLLTTAPVWAATQTATDTVTASNTAGTRYTSINVTQESATYKNVIIGIANEPPKTMNVYMAPGATISVSSAADGNGQGQRAVGIRNDTKPLTVDEALDLTVTAATAATLQGINMTIFATGVSNNEGDLTLGQAGAANTITVNADAGTYTGAETGSSKASATGIVPGFASLTISGATTLNVSAQGMTPGAGSDVIIAEAVANGIKQEDHGFTSDPIKLGGLTGTISAQGGMVNTGIGSSASAAASGIDNITTLIADSVNLTVQANGGTAGGEASGTDASAAAEGITQYIYSQVGSDVKFTVTGPTTVQVSATGGGYEGTGSASDSSATAMGVGTINTSNMLLSTIRSGIYKLQDVTAVVSAIGGEDNAGSLDPDNPTTGGNVSAVAAGIATNIGSLTAKSLDLTVSAQGGTATGKNANVNAFAYGLDQSNYMPDNPMDTASLLVTGATKLNVSATGGNTIGTGSANNTITLASGLKNFVTMAPDPRLANMDLDTVIGSVTATGGTVNTERSATTANGVMNGSTDEIGGVLTMNSLNLNVTATGAKLTGTTRKDKTSAVGLEQTGGRTNYGSTSLTITGPATLNVTATGAEPVDNGSLAKTVTKAKGLNIARSGSEAYTAATLGPVTATVTANGGTANAAQSTVKTSAIGLKSSYDMNIESLDVTVAANGGTVQGTTDDKANKGRLTTYALGISTTTSFKVTGATNFNVTATAGAATDGAVVKKTESCCYRPRS